MHERRLTKIEAHELAKKLKYDYIDYSVNGLDFSLLESELEDFIEETTPEPNLIDRLKDENRELRSQLSMVQKEFDYKHQEDLSSLEDSNRSLLNQIDALLQVVKKDEHPLVSDAKHIMKHGKGGEYSVEDLVRNCKIKIDY